MKLKPILERRSQNRIALLQNRLGADEACLIENPVDLLYFTHLDLSAGKLCVFPKKAALFVDGRYFQVAKQRTGIEVHLEEKEGVKNFLSTQPGSTLWIDGQQTPYDVVIKWKTALQGSGREVLSNASLYKSMRLIKTEQEIEAMKRSAKLLWKGFEYLIKQLKEGVTEKDLCLRFEIFCLQEGGEGLAFSPIIAFGLHTAMPHYRPQDAALKKGDIVLIDIGVIVDHYRSDMTRVVFYKGIDPELERLYRINKAAHEAALRGCIPGRALGTLDRAARDVMAKEGVEHLFVHGLGHGIGLETHEYPRVKWDAEDKDLLLEPGMVFTIEPGLYLPGKGGVRYEDTICITETGYENFYPEATQEPFTVF